MAISNVHASADVTLSSTTDVLLNLMTLTPGAGDYLAVFTMDIEIDFSVALEDVFVSIYVDGVHQVHTERNYNVDDSLSSTPDTFEQQVTHGHITVGAGEAVEIRYRKAGTNNHVGKNRSFILFPKDSGDFSQATSVTNATLNTATETLLTDMELTPGAGDYLAVFSCDVRTGNAGKPAFMFYEDGTKLAHTERTWTGETSWNDSEHVVMMAAHLTPGAGKVEVFWAVQGTVVTSTVQHRTLTLMKMDSTDDIKEASATADASSTGETYAQLNLMTLTPGADDWMGIFSTSQFYGDVGGGHDQTGVYSFFDNAVQNTNSERHQTQEDSIDNVDIPVHSIAVVSPGASEVVDIQWKGLREGVDIVERTARERTLVLVREAAAGPTVPDETLAATVQLIASGGMIGRQMI